MKESYITGNIVFYGYVDEHNNPVARPKNRFPYTYDGFVTYRNGENKECTGTVYTDRLLQQDYDKTRKLIAKHFDDKGDYWDVRPPEKIQSFLQEWLNEPSLKLVLIMEYCNVSNGYPVWRLDFSTSKTNTNALTN